jgi:hypothetical protein
LGEKGCVRRKITRKDEAENGDNPKIYEQFTHLNFQLMQKNVIVFGLIAGLLVSAFMIYSTARCYSTEDFDSNIVLGYAAMLVAFSFIFVGIKNVRDKYNDGVISFGKAFQVGLFISLTASSIYVAVWLVDYYWFIPDFMEKYTAHVLKEAQAKGASQAELKEQVAQMNYYREMYKNPLFVVLLTYAEILPIGLVISLMSALILKRKAKELTTITAR